MQLLKSDFKLDENVIYPITNTYEFNLAKENHREAMKITGYDIRITYYAKCLDGEIKIEDFLDNLKSLTGFDVSSSEDGKTFDISFCISGDDKTKADKEIKFLETCLLAISIKNKIGFERKNYSCVSNSLAQPFSAFSGEVEHVPLAVTLDDVEKVSILASKEGGEVLLLSLSAFYAQTTKRSKIIYGFLVLEELFADKAKHLFSKEEQALIISKIKELPLNCEKAEKAIGIFKNPMFFSELNRNERIAKNIVETLGGDFKETYKKIKEISELRGVYGHENVEKEEGFFDALKYIENVILRYLEKI